MESIQLLILATCVVYALAVGLYDQEFDDEWQAWKTTHKKTYADEGEETKRRLIWQENLEFIVKHNLEHQRGLHSYRLGMNEFRDMVSTCMYLQTNIFLCMSSYVTFSVHK